MKKLNVDYHQILKNLFLGLTIIGFVTALIFSFDNMTNPNYVNIYLIMPFIFFLIPYLVLSLYQLRKVESKMAVIPRFLRDIVDNVESGMDLVTSIKNTVGNEYGVLNDDIKRFANQLSWGVDFETGLLMFADNVGSSTLKRDFLLVIEARKIGGHVEKILRELSQKINNENMRNTERKNNLASNTFTGYVSFIIFIFIIILVYNNLFVGLGASMNEANNNSVADGSDDKIKIFLTLLTMLSYELAILSGFLFGLMQDNNIINGAPHVVILVVLTFIGFFFFI